MELWNHSTQYTTAGSAYDNDMEWRPFSAHITKLRAASRYMIYMYSKALQIQAWNLLTKTIFWWQLYNKNFMWDTHDADYEEYYLLRCDTMQFVECCRCFGGMHFLHLQGQRGSWASKQSLLLSEPIYISYWPFLPPFLPSLYSDNLWPLSFHASPCSYWFGLRFYPAYIHITKSCKCKCSWHQKRRSLTQKI
jgi:hypothetical protein